MANETNGFKHDQRNWNKVLNPLAPSADQCGTALCLAAFVAACSGAKPPAPIHDGTRRWYMPEWNLDRATGRTADSYAEGVMHVSEFALRQLGVTDDQAGALFNAYNALESLRSMRDLLHGKPTAPTPS